MKRPLPPARVFAPLVAVAADRRGSVAIMVALSFLVLLGMLGVAIDFARAQFVSSRIYYAADAATLAVSRENFQVSTNDQLKALAQSYFDANFPPGTMGATTSLSVATSGTPPTVQGFTVTVTATLPLVFAPLVETLGGPTIGSVGISKASGAVFTTQTSNQGGMELVIVLDNSASMKGSQEDLRGGVKALLDMLYGNADTRKNLYVGIVHYSGAVNVLQSALKNKADIVAPVVGGMANCPMATVNGKLNGSRLSNAPPKTFKFDSTTDGVEIQYCGASTLGTSSALSPNRGDADKAIKSYVAGGDTLIGEGLVWGWRMLTPSWRGLWNTKDQPGASLPLDYDLPYMKKVLVLMTDGVNHIAGRNYTAYYSDPYQTVADASKADADLMTICNAAKKDHNVVLYTITYGSDTDEQQMSDCASDPSKHYHAALPQDLAKAFTQVGTDLTTMKLVQ
ncbi:TadE/TadG family type IV pilus assembly protein [Azospirillum sp. B510]|uniref:TadE/TadG family type IV pilus assembly protein n=1 Tax=Azospirillum sp. (strain B510) TaxID=137722 RepID=UPI0005A83FA6|nr:TadE/TadG family type IV pilus assembly protein [Azospirillum sp. B510]